MSNKFKPYRNLSEMKYGEKLLFEHEPIIRNFNKIFDTEINLRYPEVALLDEHGYPCMCDVLVRYEPKNKIVDRKTFKFILNKLRDSMMKPTELFEYIQEFFTKYLEQKDITVKLNIRKQFIEETHYSFTVSNQGNYTEKKPDKEHIEKLISLFKIRDNFYYPRSSKEMLDKEKKIFSKSNIKVSKLNKNDNVGECVIRIPSVTYLNSYDGFPEFADILITLDEQDKSIDVESLRNHLYCFRYEYMNEEDMVNYVTLLIMKLEISDYVRVVMRLNPRGNVESVISTYYKRK